jgi:hypothetical protein
MEKRTSKTTVRKTYETPVLITYGTIWKLTQKTGMHGTPDSGAGTMDMRVATQV